MCYKTHSLRANDVLYPHLNLVSLSLTHRHTEHTYCTLSWCHYILFIYVFI